MNHPNLILASSSLYRQELLQRLQLPFSSHSPHIDETMFAGELAQDAALRLAQAKARKAAETYSKALIIGCDQVATLDNIHLGKPLEHAVAVSQLRLMRGRTVVFHSALCLYNPTSGHMQTAVVPFSVKFRMLHDEQIERYLRREQPYSCAGSTKSEGLGIALIESMTGDDPNALIGLPLIRLIDMLKNEGVNVI